jgi:hypothetical protein
LHQAVRVTKSVMGFRILLKELGFAPGHPRQHGCARAHRRHPLPQSL